LFAALALEEGAATGAAFAAAEAEAEADAGTAGTAAALPFPKGQNLPSIYYSRSIFSFLDKNSIYL
jgi:hypothetical protein